MTNKSGDLIGYLMRRDNLRFPEAVEKIAKVMNMSSEGEQSPDPHRGAALHPILWQGSQWAVTTYGIEARDGSYPIEKSRLKEDHAGGDSWISHVGEKTWVNVDDFATAFFVACALHGTRLTKKEVAMLRKHIEQARARK